MLLRGLCVITGGNNDNINKADRFRRLWIYPCISVMLFASDGEEDERIITRQRDGVCLCVCVR